MLKPAILYKDIIEKKMGEIAYDDSTFFYTGYPGEHEFMADFVKLRDDQFQYACIDPSKEGDDAVIAYITYRQNLFLDSVYNFGIISFKMTNMIFGKDLSDLIDKLAKMYHRIEFRMIGGNPVEKTYDKVCEKYHGVKHVLHDATKDIYGNYHDDMIYEIITDKKL